MEKPAADAGHFPTSDYVDMNRDIESGMNFTRSHDAGSTEEPVAVGQFPTTSGYVNSITDCKKRDAGSMKKRAAVSPLPTSCYQNSSEDCKEKEYSSRESFSRKCTRDAVSVEKAAAASLFPRLPLPPSGNSFKDRIKLDVSSMEKRAAVSLSPTSSHQNYSEDESMKKLDEVISELECNWKCISESITNDIEHLATALREYRQAMKQEDPTNNEQQGSQVAAPNANNEPEPNVENNGVNGRVLLHPATFPVLGFLTLWVLVGLMVHFSDNFKCSLCVHMKNKLGMDTFDICGLMAGHLIGVLGYMIPDVVDGLRGTWLRRVKKCVLRIGLMMCSAYLMEFLTDILSVLIVALWSLSHLLLADLSFGEEVGFMDLTIVAVLHGGFNVVKGTSCSFLKMLAAASVLYCLEEGNKWLAKKLVEMQLLIDKEKEREREMGMVVEEHEMDDLIGLIIKAWKAEKAREALRL